MSPRSRHKKRQQNTLYSLKTGTIVFSPDYKLKHATTPTMHSALLHNVIYLPLKFLESVTTIIELSSKRQK